MPNNTLTLDLTGRLDKLESRRAEAKDGADLIFARAMDEKTESGDVGRSLTDNERGEVREFQNTAVECQKDIDSIRTQLNLSDTSDINKVHLTDIAGTTRSTDDNQISDEEKRYDDAFWNAMRYDERRLSDDDSSILYQKNEEQRAQSAGTDSAGGFTVPEGFWGSVVDAQKAFSWIENAPVTMLNTATGNNIPIPTSDGTAEVGELLAENIEAASENVVFAEKVLGAYLFSSKQIVTSRILVQDSGVDIEAFLRNRLAQRLGRIINQYTTTGTGLGQPQGIVTGASAGATTAGATAITYDEIVDLMHSVDPAYRANGQFMFHDGILKLIRKLKDSDGRPLWQPSLVDGMVSTLLGSRYVVNQNMQATAATATVTMLYGDYSYFYVRNVMNPVMLRVEDSLKTKFQYGYVAFQRLSSILTDTAAVKKLTQA